VLAGRELDSPGERRRDDVTMIEDAWRGQMNALGGFIRTQRNLAQLSLRELASLTDLSNAYLSQVERGVHEPSVRVLKAIANALDLSSETLLAQAGLLDEARTEAGAGDVARTEAAIRSDPALTEDQMEALLAVYRSYSGQGAAE
jgi:transcriptional regulator with XRE-family HTH domain